MASIWKHPKSKYFTACWTDSTGRRLKRSNKSTDKRQAEKLARQFEEESRAKRTATQARRIPTYARPDTCAGTRSGTRSGTCASPGTCPRAGCTAAVRSGFWWA